MRNIDKKNKKNRKSNLVYNILIGIFLAIALGCGIYIGVYFYGIHKFEKQFDELAEDILSDEDSVDENGEPLYVEINTGSDENIRVLKKYSILYQENNDFIGWLTIEGTRINYPVMYTPDDCDYYIHKDFNKNYSFAGCLFIDTSSVATGDDITDNVLIYGHNMKAGTMFHDLLKYEDEDFYKEHKYIFFDTVEELGTYEVIGAFRTEIFDINDTAHYHYYDFFDAETEEDFDEYVSFVKSSTGYTTDSTAEYGDRLITLSTCAYHTDEGRFVVVAKKIN